MQRIARNNSMNNLFFVMPGKGRDVHATAKRLIGVGKIREVLITEGSYGFVVKADSEAHRQSIGREISRIVGGRTRMAVCHYQYRK